MPFHTFNNAANAWGECRECGERLGARVHDTMAMDAIAARIAADAAIPMPEWRRRELARGNGRLVAAHAIDRS